MKQHNRKPLPTDADVIQYPSRLTPLHVQDRETSKVAGAPKAWRKMTQIEAAYDQERLGAKGCDDALNRLDAGNTFASLWDCAQSAGRDSTAGFDSAGCRGSGIPLTERQQDAIRRLVGIEMHLGQKDRTIIRAVCAWGHTPAEAMALAKLGNDTRVTPRLCEALDSLIDAIERTERRGRK